VLQLFKILNFFPFRILEMAKSSLEFFQPYILFIFVNYFRYLDIYYFPESFVIVNLGEPDR